MRLTTAVLVNLLLLTSAASATDVSGNQWGVWRLEDSPINVISDIQVPPGSTLVVEAGVEVIFEGHHRFLVDSTATLIAAGSESDSIIFTARDEVTGWQGIRMEYADRLSQLSYCRFEHGRATGGYPDGYGGAVLCYFSSPTISFNTFVGNCTYQRGGAVSCLNSNPRILKNTMKCNWAKGGGGIFCSESDPIISGNVITGNAAESRGGGVYCVSSSPNMNNNTFSNNAVGHSGGAVCCYDHSSPLIKNNIIEGNSAVYRGGGIYCRDYSSPSITHNLLRRNSARSGGGINCLVESDPVIENNLLRENSAFHRGGAIHCRQSSPTVSENVIVSNWAVGIGGGIFCAEWSSPVISANTLVGNSADMAGGMCSRQSCYPHIVNCILWGNSARRAPEIDLYEAGSIVTYCDIRGGYPGEGNIDADPIFVGPERADFNLRWRSPCIDAGEGQDPDETRADIGAFYFNQDLAGIVELYPHNAPIEIPAEGGRLSADLLGQNLSGYVGGVDVWTYVVVAGKGRYGPVELYEDISAPEDSLCINDISQPVPRSAPEGEYMLVVCAGNYPFNVADSSYFYFVKTGSSGRPTARLQNQQELLRQAAVGETGLPHDYMLRQSYPNPFNATTTIGYELPVGTHVKLEIRNLLGQKVATLVDERQEAGYKSVNWDASKAASGLYFCKLTAGEYAQTRRMILIR